MKTLIQMTTIITLCFVLGIIASSAEPVMWNVNGHYYEVIQDSTVTWQEAKVLAESMGGYLATITSVEENLWITNTFGDVNAFFIGGFQPAGSAEPDGDWSWVTGEDWGYNNWGTGEPNNSLVGEEEDVLEFGFGGLNSEGEQWNDVRDFWTRGGYIVEYGDPFTSPDNDNDNYTLNDGDCDDNDPTVNPGMSEIPYNGKDDDCNPATKDDDLDNDSHGIATDCDDTDPTVNPSMTEITYNCIDNDCNPATPYDDLDADGYVLADDCNDNNPSINPDASEIKHDGLDQDCNGYDLSIDIIKAEYDDRKGNLRVEATSSIGELANLYLEGFGPMEFKGPKLKWVVNIKIGEAPGTATVCGIMGCETVVIKIK